MQQDGGEEGQEEQRERTGENAPAQREAGNQQRGLGAGLEVAEHPPDGQGQAGGEDVLGGELGGEVSKSANIVVPHGNITASLVSNMDLN